MNLRIFDLKNRVTPTPRFEVNIYIAAFYFFVAPCNNKVSDGNGPEERRGFDEVFNYV